jgi:hypothetical protein
MKLDWPLQNLSDRLRRRGKGLIGSMTFPFLTVNNRGFRGTSRATGASKPPEVSGMSGRFALQTAWRRIALAMGISAACVALAGSAEPPPEPLPGEKLDDRPPFPPENPQKSADNARFQIVKDKGIYRGTADPKTRVVKGGIEDNRPLASETQNSDEYQALFEVILHAAQFSAKELAEHGRRDLTPDDLTFGTRFQFRLDMIRF